MKTISQREGRVKGSRTQQYVIFCYVRKDKKKMEKKFELSNIRMDWYDRTIYRIRALRDFCSVHAGDLGGFVESEENLSQEGVCWIYDEAKAIGNCRIYEHAVLLDSVIVNGEARVHGYARLIDRARVFGDADIAGIVKLVGDTAIYSGVIESTDDYICLGPLGSRDDFITFFRIGDNIMVKCGCFRGDIDAFSKTVDLKYDPKHVYNRNYKAAIEFARIKLDIPDSQYLQGI